MTKHMEFIGLLLTPDAGKASHVHVRAAYKVTYNEDWAHPVIEMGETTYIRDCKDVSMRVAFECASPAYILLRDACFAKDGYK